MSQPPEDTSAHGPGEPGRRPDASMNLITTMLQRPLDPGYQEAADRRTAQGLPAQTSTKTAIVIIMAVLTGFVFAVAAQVLRAKPTAGGTVRAQLVERIEAQQAKAATDDARIVALTKEVTRLQDLELQQAGQAGLTDEMKRLDGLAAGTPLRGPGLTLTLDDAPSTRGKNGSPDRVDSAFDTGRVGAADMQIVVNGLWGGGAEAISINGHRLSSTAAIRFAGQAIIVDFRPLSRPYVITAIGDGKAMQSSFERGFAGVYLNQLATQYGITYAINQSGDLNVPADPFSRLEHAKPIPSGPQAPSVPSTSQRSTPTSSSNDSNDPNDPNDSDDNGGTS